MRLSFFAFIAGAVAATARTIQVTDGLFPLRYQGISRSGMEMFLGIPYAQDTSGRNRFKPPRPYVPARGSTIDATKPGPACPQPLGQIFSPLVLGNITEVSEDCLNLNIVRPQGYDDQKLPVMAWIHGGSFWLGSNMEPTTAPDGLIRQSIENGLPIIHVAMNYRLGFFGFAQSDTLKDEGSENAGLRDQRLAIEWIRDNIEHFGGDPEKITIFGQSSGGLAIGMQMLAYGGAKPLPFQQGIAQSQALEPGITGNFSIDAMIRLVDHVGCNATSVHSPQTVTCLRQLDTETLRNAAIATYASTIGDNIGDIWLPSVDGDFLPAPPSQLIAEGRFGKASFMSGWTQDDLNFFTDVSISTEKDTYDFIRAYLPALPEQSLENLLSIYPVEEFTPGPKTNLAAEFYRSARIFRDVLMVCPSIHLGFGVDKTHSTPVYFYNFNSTILDPILTFTTNVSGLGAVHTSEFAYIFDSIHSYNVSGWPFNPTEADYELVKRASRSWSSFAALGSPSPPSLQVTLQGWQEAFDQLDGPYLMTIGGPSEGLTALRGANATQAMKVQRLDERCAFLNDPAVIKALQY